MTQQALNGSGEMQDFSRPLEPVRFRVNADVFEAAPDLPAGVAFDLIAVWGKVQQAEDGDAKVNAIQDIFRRVLLPASAERFEQRLRDVVTPIGATQLVEIVQWLLERYGLRPTQPSPASSDGSGSRDGGTTSTDASPSPGLIPTSSPSPAS